MQIIQIRRRSKMPTVLGNSKISLQKGTAKLPRIKSSVAMNSSISGKKYGYLN